MRKRLLFWLSLIVAAALPSVALAAGPGKSPPGALTWSDVIVIFIATLAAFFWVLSVME